MALGDLKEQFDTVIDSGLFHVFDDDRRARYVSSLATVVGAGGRVLLACFSDGQPGVWGPRHVREAELRDAFAAGWFVESIEATQIPDESCSGRRQGMVGPYSPGHRVSVHA